MVTNVSAGSHSDINIGELSEATGLSSAELDALLSQAASTVNPASVATATQIDPVLLAQAGVTETAPVIIRTVEGETAEFFMRNGTLYMRTSAGVQGGRAAANAFANAAARTSSVASQSLRVFGNSAVTAILTELLFPQPAGPANEEQIARNFDAAVNLLQAAVESDPTGSLLLDQDGGYRTLTNRNTGVVIARVTARADGPELWTNPNLNEDGTFTPWSDFIPVNANTTNGALGSLRIPEQPYIPPIPDILADQPSQPVQPEIGATWGVTFGDSGLYATIRSTEANRLADTGEGFSILYYLNNVEHHRGLNATNYPDALQEVADWFYSGTLPGISSRHSAPVTLPGYEGPIAITNLNLAGATTWLAEYQTEDGSTYSLPIPDATSLSNATETVLNAYWGGVLPGLPPVETEIPQAPTYPYPDVVDPWDTPDNAGVVTEPYPQVRDPWEDDAPATESGSDGAEPPSEPPTGGNGGNGPDNTGNNNGDNGSSGPGGPEQPSGRPQRLFGTGLEEDALIAAGQAVVNVVTAGASFIYYQGTERRTGSPISEDNVLQELAALQQDPDNYIDLNYENSLFGFSTGDRLYNMNGHLFEMDTGESRTYFRRYPTISTKICFDFSKIKVLIAKMSTFPNS